MDFNTQKTGWDLLKDEERKKQRFFYRGAASAPAPAPPSPLLLLRESRFRIRSSSAVSKALVSLMLAAMGPSELAGRCAAAAPMSPPGAGWP